MVTQAEGIPAASSQIEMLTLELMELADEAESYFNEGGEGGRPHLSGALEVTLACEAFKWTARLQQCLDVLARIASGSPVPSLPALPLDEPEVAELPPRARALVAATRELYRRVRLLGLQREEHRAVVSPARLLIERLQASLAV